MGSRKEIFAKGVFPWIKDWEHKETPQAVQYPAGDVTYAVQSRSIGVYPNEQDLLPLAKLEVTYSYKERPNLEYKLLEMRLRLDKEDNLVGLDNNQFTFWHHSGDGSSYQLVYRVNRKQHNLATVSSIHKYARGAADECLDVERGLAEIASYPEGTGLKIPKTVDWAANFNLYYFGKIAPNAPLTGSAIAVQPLRP